MPNQAQLSSQPYLPPFLEEHFYLIPLSWLHAVAEAGDLDARELLLARVVDGQIIFEEQHGEQAWHQVGGMARPFFTRRTYERHRKNLLSKGFLHKYSRASRPAGVTKAAWQDLQRGIKYTVTAWPTDAWLYRPRTYLDNRWPVWLGNSDVASRLILLALLAEAVRLESDARLPEQVTLSWRQICTFVEQRLGDEAGDHRVAQQTAMVRKGIQELMVLQAVTETTSGPLRYALSLTVFDQRPQWSIPAIAQRCKADLTQDGLLVELVRDLMIHCWEPVTRLQRVWNAVQASRRTAALLDESDLLDLQKFLRTQRQQAPPHRHDHVLQAFLRQRQQTGTRLVGGLFVLPAEEIALAQVTVEGLPLTMPASSAHGLAATQLWVRCERSDGLTVTEAQAILALSHWIVWQEQADALPVAIPLAGHPPRTLSIDFGYVLRANQLHRRLDYARPFEVILRCRHPDPRLKLHCRFRLLFTRGKNT